MASREQPAGGAAAGPSQPAKPESKPPPRVDESGTDTDEDGELIKAKARAVQEKAKQAPAPTAKRRATGLLLTSLFLLESKVPLPSDLLKHLLSQSEAGAVNAIHSTRFGSPRVETQELWSVCFWHQHCLDIIGVRVSHPCVEVGDSGAHWMQASLAWVQGSHWDC